MNGDKVTWYIRSGCWCPAYRNDETLTAGGWSGGGWLRGAGGGALGGLPPGSGDSRAGAHQAGRSGC